MRWIGSNQEEVDQTTTKEYNATCLRRPGIQFDNLALVPGNLLSFKARYQGIANSLPRGTVLIILPRSHSPQRDVLETTGALLKAKGCRVTILPVERIG